MRKLTEFETGAYEVLCREGSVLIGRDDLRPEPRQIMLTVMNALVRKKRATVEATDDGPRFYPVGAP